MAVYVDGAKNPLNQMLMSHMLADTEEELHAMAGAIGLKRAWFQNHGTPHYDLCQAKRQLAIQRGAVQVGRRELVAIIRRLRQEHGARPESAQSTPDHTKGTSCANPY